LCPVKRLYLRLKCVECRYDTFLILRGGWAARGWLPADAALALGWARQAQELVQGGPVPDANATRRWLPALSLGERAAALQQIGRKAEATAAARLALVQWQAQWQAQPPARHAAYVARDRPAAAQP